MRTLLRAISYAVIVGVGIDAFFFAWLLAEDQGGLSRGHAQVVAAIAAVLASAVTWVMANLVKSSRRGRLIAAAARRMPTRSAVGQRAAAPTVTAAAPAAPMVASSPLASATAEERAAVFALLGRRHEARATDNGADDLVRAGRDTADIDEGEDGTAQLELPQSRFRLSRFDLNADSSTISTFEFERYADDDEFETVLPPAAPLFATPAVGTASVAEPLVDGVDALHDGPDDDAGTEVPLFPAPRTDPDGRGPDPIATPGVVLADSVASARAALNEATDQYGADDPRALRAKAGLAYALLAHGDLAQAIGVYEETVIEAEPVLGEDHLETLTWRGALAAAYELDGRVDEAIELYAWTLEGRERALGRDHPDTQQVRSDIAIATAVRANLSHGRA